ncbi:MAG: HpcH/HpaI aldolase family protein [Armatimonadota bacterium]
MNGRELLAALRQGKRVYGTLVTSASPLWPQAVSSAGVDFVFIDTEHIPIGRDVLSSMCQVYRAVGLAPIVRISSPDPHQASAVLDGGAEGVLAPYIETAQQVQELRGAVKLRPLKGERLRKVLSGEEECEQELADYLARRNDGNLLLLNVESRPALDALDDILAVPQVDGVVIGPHDLTCSLGIPEQYHHPVFESAVRRIIQKARAVSTAAGIHYWEAGRLAEWAKEGLNLIIYSSDMRCFAESMARDLAAIKGAVGDGSDA